ncbi:MAG: hypothetical protein IKQ17_14705 [Kiritimatiellae bacterium]|nr:hypothetical protein [Kiritimatiellia bacterium]
MNIRMGLTLLTMLVAATASAEGGGWEREYCADISASSQLFSLGSVRADHAVWMMEADFEQRLSAFGHVLLGYWSLSDLGGSGDRSRRSYVYESDPCLFYGYDWDFADGWRLRTRIGMIWVFNEGYNVDVIHLFREWTYMGELKSPWVTLHGQTRVVDGLGTYVRIGAFRSFDIAGGLFSLAPHVSLHGGSERWNRNRYGDFVEGRSISQGLGTVDYGMRLCVPLEWGMSWYFDVSGYDALDSRTRTQMRERRRRGSTMKLDACFVTSGFSWEF